MWKRSLEGREGGYRPGSTDTRDSLSRLDLLSPHGSVREKENRRDDDSGIPSSFSTISSLLRYNVYMYYMYVFIYMRYSVVGYITLRLFPPRKAYPSIATRVRILVSSLGTVPLVYKQQTGETSSVVQFTSTRKGTSAVACG